MLLGSNRWPVDTVGDFVEAAGIAQVVIVTVATPQRRGYGPAVGALATLQQHRIICARRIGHNSYGYYHGFILGKLPAKQLARCYLCTSLSVSRSLGLSVSQIDTD